MVHSILKAVALIVVAAHIASAATFDISVKENDTRQTMIGFGGSIMNWHDQAKSEDWARFCAQELGISIVRCEIHPDIICNNNCLGNQTNWGKTLKLIWQK